MKIIKFIGNESSYSSQLVTYLAKTFAINKFKVAVCDMTQEKKMYYFFTYNKNLEIKEPITREEIDFYFTETTINKAYDFLFISKEKYENMDINSLNFIITTQDIENILKTSKLIENMESINLLLNNYLDDCKVTKRVIERLFNKRINDYFEVSVLDDDYLKYLNNKIDGKLNIKKFSKEYRSSLNNLMNFIVKGSV